MHPVAAFHKFSSEKQVTRQTPQAFLIHDYADNTVPCQNSIMYRDSCLRKLVPASFLRVYNCGPSHGFGMSCGRWADSASAWMTKQGIYTPATGIHKGNGLSGTICNDLKSGNAAAIQWYDLRGTRLKLQGSAIPEGVAIRVAIDKNGRVLSSGKRVASVIIMKGKVIKQ